MVSISSIMGWSQPLRASRKIALLDAVFADDRAPPTLHGPVHRLVRLEDPPHLAALLRRPLGRVEVQLVEARGHPPVLPLALDAEGEDPHPVDLALAQQEAQPPDREQPAVHLLEHLV